MRVEVEDTEILRVSIYTLQQLSRCASAETSF